MAAGSGVHRFSHPTYGEMAAGGGGAQVTEKRTAEIAADRLLNLAEFGGDWSSFFAASVISLDSATSEVAGLPPPGPFYETFNELYESIIGDLGRVKSTVSGIRGLSKRLQELFFLMVCNEEVKEEDLSFFWEEYTSSSRVEEVRIGDLRAVALSHYPSVYTAFARDFSSSVPSRRFPEVALINAYRPFFPFKGGDLEEERTHQRTRVLTLHRECGGVPFEIDSRKSTQVHFLATIERAFFQDPPFPFSGEIGELPTIFRDLYAFYNGLLGIIPVGIDKREWISERREYLIKKHGVYIVELLGEEGKRSIEMVEAFLFSSPSFLFRFLQAKIQHFPGVLAKSLLWGSSLFFPLLYPKCIERYDPLIDKNVLETERKMIREILLLIEYIPLEVARVFAEGVSQVIREDETIAASWDGERIYDVPVLPHGLELYRAVFLRYVLLILPRKGTQ